MSSTRLAIKAGLYCTEGKCSRKRNGKSGADCLSLWAQLRRYRRDWLPIAKPSLKGETRVSGSANGEACHS